MWYYYKENSEEAIEIKTVEDMPEGTVGFVYLIVNLSNGKRYIGKKSIYSETTKKLGKRAIAALTDKRASKKQKIKKESDWLCYNGSCKELLEDIAKGDLIEKTILKFCFDKISLTYNEVRYQFLYDVLGSDEWYNGNILNRFYRPKDNKYYRL